MCGILCLFSSRTPELVNTRVNSGLKKLYHRGPDNSMSHTVNIAGGTVALGHTRLSIIDLSIAGHQPMHNNDSRYTIVFNGEIYNYKELRVQLSKLGYHFITKTDTEVLLAAWIKWGENCLLHLIGMFSFVILDRHEKTLTCVRDGFGIKPLYYSFDNEDILVASEIPALLTLKNTKTDVNWQRSYDYLVHGTYENTPETFFSEVTQLMPGHLLKINLTEIKKSIPKKWYIPKITERTDLNYKQAAEYLRESFLESVKLHLRSDVKIGAALSGGIDSSALVCAINHIDPKLPINTFSFIADDYHVNEEKWIDLVNQHVGAKAHKVRITSNELLQDIDGLIQSQAEPFGSMSIYAQFRVYKLAKENGITVTLDGQGADEVLGGYIGFPGERIRSLLDCGQFKEAASFLFKWSKWPNRNLKMGLRAAFAEISTGVPHELMRSLARMNETPIWIRNDIIKSMNITEKVKRFRSGPKAYGRRVVAQMENMLTNHGLSALLRHGDRNSMNFSIESRVPFLTLEMVELMLSMPEDFLISPRGETKYLFRESMKGIIPDEVLFRKDKIGFEPPEKKWIMSIASQARIWLSEDMQVPFINRELLLAQFDEVIAGRRQFTWQVWRWINFYRWKACFIS